MAQLITAAVGKNPQGLVVSIPDATALGPAIQSAVDAGIPVISANSGSDVYKSLGILTHVGQDEFPAGKGAGEKMAAAGRQERHLHQPGGRQRRPSTPAARASPRASAPPPSPPSSRST